MASKLTKGEFIKKFATEAKIQPKEAKRLLEAQKNVIFGKAGLKTKAAVATPLGIFKARHVPASRGGKLVRNPGTGQMVKSKPKPAQTKVRLVVPKAIKQGLR